ncbi:MAG: glucose-6-phosphate isomerase [Oligoflexia bacterium]|nr:glucose-6-phosphate isomerase [Oligoflexia bacterium]
MEALSLWERFKSYYCEDPKSGFAIDISRVGFENNFFSAHQELFERALDQVSQLEQGAIANPDEGRQVGHYWLRDSRLAPKTEFRAQIDAAISAAKAFAEGVHTGRIAALQGGRFEYMLVVGIGGSALGPQFVHNALTSERDRVAPFFFDNTDPDGMDKTLSAIPDLAKTLVIIISKSGGTKETRNGQLIAKRAFAKAGLDFSRAFVAVTCEGSELDKCAIAEKWLARFPMWDWIGGRTSELSVVGLLPAALQGFDIDLMLQGAREMDVLTRRREVPQNPALLLAAAWFKASSGKGVKDMVVLPYKDRLELFSRYLQQLVMESLGKERDLSGAVVNQGLAVYGNKGSTDQHAYVQQLRDGVNNFFAVFIEVLRDPSSKISAAGEYIHTEQVEPGARCGDYLYGFLEGTRKALYDSGRESVSLCVREVSEYSIGQLIALFERAVSFYASFVNINAYHQPGVEAGKKAAAQVLDLQQKVEKFMRSQSAALTLEEIAAGTGLDSQVETIFRLLRRYSANGRAEMVAGAGPFGRKYRLI